MERSQHREDSTVIDRLTALEARDAAKDNEIEKLKRMVAVLMRAATATVIRAAEVDAKDLLTLKDAAFEAGVASEGTIRFWFSKGLPFETIGVKRYVSRQALAEFVAGRK